MKKLIFYILSLILIFKFNKCFSQDDWKLICSSNEIYSAHFINENNGWMFAGDIRYKTTDGGISWSLPIPTSPSIGLSGGAYFTYPNYISFPDSLIGWACQNSNVLLKTTNGGNTWITMIPSLSSQSFTCISFINKMTGWLGGNNVYKTTNGGINWFQICNQKPASMSLINENLGFFMTNSDTVFKTTNGGINWETQKVSNNQNVSSIIKFADNLNGWVMSNPGSIFKSTNSGINWIPYPAPYGNSVNLYFINNTTGWLSIAGNKLYKTTNGAENWFNQIYTSGLPTEYVYRDIYFKNSNTGWVFSSRGQLLKTTNGGSNWYNQISPPPQFIKQISFINSNMGYCIADNSYIWKTTDKGYSWSLKYKAGNDLNELQVIDAYNCIAIGVDDICVKSTDGGETWQNLSATNVYYLDGLYFLNNTTGWICGNNGLIAKTTNGGLNFQLQNSGLTELLTSISFINSNTGYTLSNNGRLLSTTNGGQNWDSTLIGNYNLNKIKFIDSLTGYIQGFKVTTSGMNVTSKNIILKTTNGGQNWSTVFFETLSGSQYIIDMDFRNANTGIITYFSGQVKKTENSGINWTIVSMPLSRIYGSICLLNETDGWIAGEKGTVVSITPQVGIINISTSIPTKMNLKQNYPNPFNPNTNIEFSIPKSSLAKLVIYDITGREITRLVNEVLSAGTYKVSWNAFNYPSGIYYYKLILDDFAETKKMVLIK